jgi:hypothetical protein
MSERPTLAPHRGTMRADLADLPAFDDSTFGLVIPEAVGDAADPAWFDDVALEWDQRGPATWRCTGAVPGELAYTATVSLAADAVDVEIELRNESDRRWEHGVAFTCCNPGPGTPVTDYECTRHWTAVDGDLTRLTTLPRAFSPRPTVQLYSVEGAPAGHEIPFVDRFDATPDVRCEPWLAIESVEGDRHLAVASDPPLFLFQNMEYSCIHSCPSFGSLAPGEAATGLSRVYAVEGSLSALRARMRAEFDW